MEQAITLKIILEAPTPGVWFGLQKGKGNPYQTVQTQHSNGENLVFNCPCNIKLSEGKPAAYAGPFIQGKTGENFIYLDIGQLAGQLGSAWNRRLKIPLMGILPETIQSLLANPKLMLETTVAGTGKDGGPNCATVKPFGGWRLNNPQ